MEPYKIYDFEDEKAWLKGRLNGIGGSDASAVVGKNPYKTNIELFEEKTGRRIVPDISEKPYVIYGKEAEQYIRELFRLDYPQYQVMMKKADPKMYRWVWLGEAIGVDELIYYMFSDRHRQKPDPDRRYDRIYIGGDYGQQNATTFEAFGLDTYRKKFPGLGEYYHSGRESGRQKSPSEYARDLVEFMDGLHEQYENRIFYIFLDPSAKGLAEEVRRATRTGLDYQVFLRDAENDVALGISRVQKALVFDIMSISPKQEYAVQEFGTYEYDKKSIEKGKEVPVKEADHCMDAIRYVVMGAWSNIKHWLPLDIVEDDVNIGDIGSREVREEDEYL